MIPFGNIGFAQLGQDTCPPGTFRTDAGKCVKVSVSQDQSNLVAGRDVEITREFEINGDRFVQFKPKELQPVSLGGGLPPWVWGVGGVLVVGVLLFAFMKD